MKTVFGELTRRSVFRVGMTYLVVAWLVVQLVNNLIPLLNIPVWVGKAILLALIAGFPISLVLAWAYELTPEGIKRDTGPSGVQARRSGFGRRWDFVIIIGLVIALGYSFWGRFSASPANGSAGTVTLAVLPFEDLSPNKDQGYLAGGIAEELLNSLASVKDLRVTARTSSFQFKGKNEDMRTIGKALGVDNLLEGSVRKDGGEIRITTQLINAESGYQVWSKTYERKLTDVFAIEDEIAKSVADALQITLHVGDLAKAPGMTRNVDAWEEYLKGAAGLEAAEQTLSPEGFQKAIGHFQRATALDPSFTLAWVASAPAYYYGAAVMPDRAAEWRQKALDASRRAGEISPNAPYILLNKADLASFEGNWREAGAMAEQVYGPKAKPRPPDSTLYWYGAFLLEVGRVRDSISPLERNRPADPLSPKVAILLGVAYSDAGRADEAYEEFRRAAMVGGGQAISDNVALVTAMASGNRDDIRKYLPKQDPAAPQEDNVGAAVARFVDDPAGGRAEIRRLAADETVARSPSNFGVLAMWSAYFDDPETALALIRRFYDSKITRDLVSMSLWEPIYHGMRKLPGFKDLVREMGLVDYWLTYGWADACHPVGDNDFECS